MGRIITVDAEIDMRDIDTDDLREELERRGQSAAMTKIPSSALLEPVTMIAERHELDIVRARALSGDYQPAAEMLLNLLRDATGRAII